MTKPQIDHHGVEQAAEAPPHRAGDPHTEALELECAELRRRLEIVYASRSWRLTAPIRRVAELARRMRSRPAVPSLGDASNMSEAEDPAFPPPLLRERVSGSQDLDWFRQSGAMALEDVEAALQTVGRSLAEFSRIYDFGCGCGRLTLPLAERVGADRVTASDNDGEAVAWLARRLPKGRVEVNPTLPPLGYEDGEFDLILGWSVMTHLPESYQDAWLAELSRVLAPGGVMLQTVHGPTHFDVIGSAPDDAIRNALPSEGFVYYEHYGPDSPFESYYQTSFHHPDYIRTHWGEWFQVIEVLPGGARPNQDMVVLLAGGTASSS